MKLLPDHNLSPRLLNRLGDLYPESTHVFLVGLDRTDDRTVWNFARENDYLIVSKDSDFNDLSVVWGHPPKIVWIRRANCSTGDIEAILRNGFAAITALNQDAETAVLMLF